jgi:hypothetical protein
MSQISILTLTKIARKKLALLEFFACLEAGEKHVQDVETWREKKNSFMSRWELSINNFPISRSNVVRLQGAARGT